MRSHDEERRPVPLSLNQRLTGQVSNGDLARMSFSGDYKGRLIRSEEGDGKKVAVLELKAVGPWVTYGKVILWVSLEEAHLLKTEFYTSSDKLSDCWFSSK